MLLSDEYILMLPGFVEDESQKVVLYEIQSILELQQADKLLEGHPSADLPEATWGTIDFPVYRVRRWLDKDRLVKVKLNTGGSLRVTYCEPKEWRQHITEEQWQWLCQVCEVSQIYCEELVKQGEVVEPEPRKEKPKKKKAKAKGRRKRQKNIMETDYV